MASGEGGISDDSGGQGAQYSALQGHGDVITHMVDAFNNKKMPHAWLFTGPSGIGKAKFAKQLAASIIAISDEQDALFDAGPDLRFLSSSDAPAFRQVMQGAHPDFLYISADGDEKNKSGTIKTDQIRALIPFFSHKSATGGWRVAIIDALDDVNVNGANAMLKILEEPPEKALLFLICARKGRVLPTIRSRCRTLEFTPLSVDEQLHILETHYPEADKTLLQNLAHISAGSVGFALQMAESDAFDLYEATCRLLGDSKAAQSDMLAISGKWGRAGGQQKQMVDIAKRCFGNLISNAALCAAQNKVPAKILPFEDALIQKLASHAPSYELAQFHIHFLKEVERAETSYLDFNSVFLMLFHKIHSLAHAK